MPERLRSDSDACSDITCMLTDVDGVLTDGGIIYDSSGNETKRFHVRDRTATKVWIRSGLTFGIITGRDSVMVDRRAKELGIDQVHQGVDDKLECARQIVAQLGCGLENVCYLGDDLPDVELLGAVGLAVTPSDAVEDARRNAHWVLQCAGGQGVIRETVERVLRAKGQWKPSRE